MLVRSADFSSIKRNLRYFMVVAGLLMLTGCLGYPRPVKTLQPLPADVKTLAMIRTTWDKTRPDAFCQPDIGDDIYRQMKQSLQDLGYQVVDFKVPPLDNSNRPDPVAGMSGAELLHNAPQSVDGIFRLRVVEYLDAALCDTGYESKSLDLTAVAEIFARKDGKLLWQTRQLCGDISGRTRDVVYNCSVGLSQRIARQLPPASH
ncbi:hypothetical protein [Geopsychrobacter electrodiphilus]|uniref:hypothetical protein n=1 Tax=Geopsychrobacter electrodiphilus TaxID=225196 RepID=UPI00035E958D|nr:hypothetical protein [Geopsychrobacter electrodiphilus]